MYKLISTLGNLNLANFLSNNVDDFSPFADFNPRNVNIVSTLGQEATLINPVTGRKITVAYTLDIENLNYIRLSLRRDVDNTSKYEIKRLFKNYVAPILSRCPIDTKLMHRTFHLYCAKLVAECFNNPESTAYAKENPGCLGFTPEEVVFQAANPQSAKSFTINCVRRGKRHIPYRTNTQLIVQPGRVLCNWFNRPLGPPEPPDATTIEFILAQLQARYQKELAPHINTIGQ